jgi:phosphoribosylanthranilate isomerase
MNKPWFLAGGLTPENIEEALSYQPDGVDVSSGVETGGSKCELKLGRFVSRVREFDSRNGVPT